VINLASEGSAPIAVIDAAGRLKGVVVKGAILAALAKPSSDQQALDVGHGRITGSSVSSMAAVERGSEHV